METQTFTFASVRADATFLWPGTGYFIWGGVVLFVFPRQPR